MVVAAHRGVERAADLVEVAAERAEPVVQLAAEPWISRACSASASWVQPWATVRSRAISVVGVASTTCRVAAYSSRSGSASSAAAEERLGRHEHHHELRRVRQRAPVALRRQRVDVATAAGATWRRRCRSRLVVVVGGAGVEVGVERHLGVDDDSRPPARRTTRSGRRAPSSRRTCSLKSQCSTMPGQLDRPPQVQLAPPAAHLRLAQRRGQRSGLDAGAGRWCAACRRPAGQLALPGRPLLLEVAHLVVQPLEPLHHLGLVDHPRRHRRAGQAERPRRAQTTARRAERSRAAARPAAGGA